MKIALQSLQLRNVRQWEAAGNGNDTLEETDLKKACFQSQCGTNRYHKEDMCRVVMYIHLFINRNIDFCLSNLNQISQDEYKQ